MFFRFVFRGCTGVIAGKLERKQASQRASQPASSQPAGLAQRNWIRNPTKIGEKSLKRFAPSQLPFSELTSLLQLQTSSGCLAACDNCCFFATFFESFIMLLNVNYIWRCKVFSHPFLILAVACSDWINSVRVVSVSFFLWWSLELFSYCSVEISCSEHRLRGGFKATDMKLVACAPKTMPIYLTVSEDEHC